MIRRSHWLAILLIPLLLSAQSAQAARDIRAAQLQVDEARLALAGKRYVAAAEHMEKAFAYDQNPLWLANAGYARMMAGQQERAVEALSAALADKNLEGDARQRAVERLGKASAAKAFIQRSDEAKTAGDLTAAARAYDEAYVAVPIGPYALEAAILWERAGNSENAQTRYQQAAAAQDLTPEQQRLTVEALARVARGEQVEAPPTTVQRDGTPTVVQVSDPPPKSGTPVMGWALVGTGAAAIVAGVVVVVIGNGKAADLRAAQDGARDGVTDDLSRADALALESDAGVFQTAGVITAIAGAAMSATGLVLVLTSGDERETRGDVRLGWGFTGNGGFITATGAW
jgi:tetratricopeptide (TPR) repeat protein